MKSEQSSMLSQVIVETAEQLINEVYPNIVENYTNSEWLLERVILSTKTNIVNDPCP